MARVYATYQIEIHKYFLYKLFGLRSRIWFKVESAMINSVPVSVWVTYQMGWLIVLTKVIESVKRIGI